MTFVLLASVSALASFAIVVAVASAALALGFPAAAAALDRYAPASRAALLFRLRLAPALMATICGFAVALPIFVWFEPFDTDEPVSRTLAAIACAGAAVIVRGLWRAWSAWRATARISAEWQRQGRPLAAIDAALPVYAIDASFPTVAVVGMTRPVLFVAERVLAECSTDEVRAMIAHECAHVRARDNVKRFLLRACPDLLGHRTALTRAWTAAAEEAADAQAARSRPGCALDLAQALIRVARLAPMSTPELASAFFPGGDIDRRVRRLVEPVAAPDVPAVLARWVPLSLAVAILTAAILLAPVLHQMMETIVRLVP